MAFWNRRKKSDDPSLPKEVKEYYSAEKRERVGVASALAIGTLVVTVLLAIGLFFGGRWAWRHVLHPNKNRGGVATVKAPDDITGSTTGSSSSRSSSNTSSKTTSPTPPTSTSSSQGAATTTTAPNSSTNTQTANLPNTGPQSLLPVVMVVALCGILIAELYQRSVSRR